MGVIMPASLPSRLFLALVTFSFWNLSQSHSINIPATGTFKAESNLQKDKINTWIQAMTRTLRSPVIPNPSTWPLESRFPEEIRSRASKNQAGLDMDMVLKEIKRSIEQNLDVWRLTGKRIQLATVGRTT